MAQLLKLFGRCVVDGTKVPFAWQFLTYGSSTEWETIANIYREDLLSIGVKMDPIAVEWSTHLKKMEDREFDAVSAAWVPAWEADLMQIWHSQEADRPKSSNRIGFRNKDADRIAEALRREFDLDKRIGLLKELDKIVTGEHHWILEWTAPYERFVYWDKFGYPDGILTRVGSYRDIPTLWWFDPAKQRALEEARKSGGTLPVGASDNRYWLDYGEREKKGSQEAR